MMDAKKPLVKFLDEALPRLISLLVLAGGLAMAANFRGPFDLPDSDLQQLDIVVDRWMIDAQSTRRDLELRARGYEPTFEVSSIRFSRFDFAGFKKEFRLGDPLSVTVRKGTLEGAPRWVQVYAIVYRAEVQQPGEPLWRFPKRKPLAAEAKGSVVKIGCGTRTRT